MAQVGIFCVYQSGSFDVHQRHNGVLRLKRTVRYSIDDVVVLFNLLKRHVTVSFDFYCLTDAEIRYPGINKIKLNHDWPGWWAKIELFRPDLPFASLIYFDLDTIIRGNIDHILKYEHKFSMLENLSYLADPVKFRDNKGAGSGVMAWKSSLGFCIYNKFAQSPGQYINEYTETNKWGDQGFIQDVLSSQSIPIEYLQSRFPGIGSTKYNDINKLIIACSHGSK